MHKILVVDDDTDIRLLLERYLSKKGFEMQTASTGSEAVQVGKNNPFDVILLDLKLPDGDGIDVMKKLKIFLPKSQVIFITGYSDVRTAVKTLKEGAYEYVVKPLHPEEILHTIKDAINVAKEKEAVEEEAIKNRRKRNISPKVQQKFVVGTSPQSENIQKHITLIAPTDLSVIISGETGTGKEFVARSIHEKSQRAEGPFMAVDCGALPKDLAGSELFGHVKGAFTGALQDKKGCFELANGGTLFLDEIGNLTYENQIKLLRVLQERKVRRIGGDKEIIVDVRIIVATNENLLKLVQEGGFREDIYHRLNEFNIHIPPIRARKDDIEVFSTHFLEMANAQLQKQVSGFSENTMDKLKQYIWHGNLRELRNVIKRAVLMTEGEQIEEKNLPPEILIPQENQNGTDDHFEWMFDEITDLKSVAEKAERNAILHTLRKTGFNKSKTAEILKIDRKTLYNKMKAYQIELS
jgi:two-component system response regulator HydG